jgi:hypothetical protein
MADRGESRCGRSDDLCERADVEKESQGRLLTMIGLNAAYGVAVAHNYGVATRQKR